MRRAIIQTTLMCIFSAALNTFSATNQYLFVGHPRDDGPGEIVQRNVERVDYAAFDLLLLGGDYTWHGTGTRETVDYLNAIFNLSAPTTLAALGNHDTGHKSYFSDITARPLCYTFKTNQIAFVVLDTTDNSKNILGDELQMLEDTVHALSTETHLVVIHHHLIWLADYPPLADLIGSPLIGASSANLSGLNFYDEVYPLLLQARTKGIEVICLAGDRTGSETEEFFIDHTTDDGVRFIAAGLKEELTPELRTVVVLEHDDTAGTLTPIFKHLTDLPRIPDEPLVINELHYAPAEQGNAPIFIELINCGTEPYDLSGATFTAGIDFSFPDNTHIAPGDYVLITANSNTLARPGIHVFSLNSETLPNPENPMWLRNSLGLEIDYVAYDADAPWPLLADGLGPSLMLIDPALDNSRAIHWAASDQFGGTPGEINIPSPRPETLALTQNTATIRWNGVATNAWYQLDYTSTLSPPDWQPAGSLTQATTAWIELTDTNAVSAQRYFRLSRFFP